MAQAHSIDSVESQRSQVFALWSSGWSGAQICTKLADLHGSRGLSKTTVYAWIERFKDGRVSVSDQPRSGRPSLSSGGDAVDRIERLLQTDARLTVREVSDRVNIPKSTAHDIMRDQLGMSKI